MKLNRRTPVSRTAGEPPVRAKEGASSGKPAAEQTHKQSPLLDGSLAYAIKRAQVRCDEALTRFVNPAISPARFSALLTIGANPGISQVALGGLLNIAGPSVVKVVDDLERRDLVRRAPTTDRRVYALQLSETGSVDLKRYQAAFAACEKNLAARLTSAERVQLLQLLARVAPDEA